MQSNKKRQGRLRLQVTLTVWLTLSVSLFVLALAGSFWATKEVTTYATATYKANLGAIVSAFDREVLQFELMLSQLSNTAWVKRILYMQGSTVDRNRVSDFSMMEYQQQLNSWKLSNSLLAEIGIIFFEKDLVIASYGRSNIAFLSNNALRVPNLSRSDWHALPQHMVLGSVKQFSSPNINKFGAQNAGTILVYPMHDGITTKVRAAMFVVLHHQSIRKSLESLLLANLAKEATLVVSAPNDTYPIVIGTANQENTERIAIVSALPGWEFRMDVPKSVALADTSRVRGVLLIAAGSLWLVSLLASTALIGRFLTPFDRIVRMFSEGQESGRRFVNEYAEIRRGISRLMEQKAKLEQDMLRRQAMAYATAFNTLLTGKYEGEDDLQEILSVLDLRLDGSSYCVCLILPAYGSGNQVPAVQSVRRALEPLQQQGQVLAGFADSTLALIVSVDSAVPLHNQVTAILTQLPECCLVLGELVANVEAITDSYRTAQTAKDYRLVSEGFRLIRYDCALLSKGGYSFPLQLERELLQSIKNGDSKTALSIYEGIYQSNLVDEKASFRSMQNLLSNVHLDIVKLMQAEEVGAYPQTPYESDASLEDQHKALSSLIVEVSGIHRERIQSIPEKAESYAKYVRENLFDSRLSLTMIADAFDVSNSMVSRQFADFWGENFLSYVNRLRVESACDLLTQYPHLDVREIATMVGYENDVTFRRQFKKTTGHTPSAFRDGRLE